MASSYLQERRKKIKTKELAHRQRLGSKWMIQSNAKQNLAGIIYVYCLYTVYLQVFCTWSHGWHLHVPPADLSNSQPKSGFACAGKVSRDSVRQPCSTCWSTSDFWRFFLNTLLFCTLLNVSPYMRVYIYIYSFTYRIHSYIYIIFLI